MENTPILTHIEGESLPPTVSDVIKDIQRLMMDDQIFANQQISIPNMPQEFLCAEVDQTEKQKMLDLAGVDKHHQSTDLKCYKIGVPFLLRGFHFTNSTPCFNWAGNMIRFERYCNGIAVVNVKAIIVSERNDLTGKIIFYKQDIPTEIEMLRSKILRNFHKSSLVQKQTERLRLVSSHKMTITWLRSRLDKALYKYREVEKNVEVIATIKQKDGSPLFLRLHVEQAEQQEGSNKVITYDFLFNFFPAFRITKCELFMPVFSKDDEITETSSKTDVHFLWQRITMCSESSNHTHRHRISNCMHGSPLPRISEITSAAQANLTEAAKAEREAYKTSIQRAREMTTSQQNECVRCNNPASRMLLEYYYHYGHISEQEMEQTRTFVWDILQFLVINIQENCKHTEPRIIELVESGSVSEKLRVVKPDEFDVTIKVDLPGSTDCYTFKSDDNFPTGYFICKIRPSNSFSRVLRRCVKKNEFGHCLDPEQLAFGWLAGKLQTSIIKYVKNESRSQADLKLKRGGPALLLEIRPPMSSKSTMPRKISVDLVLALKFGKDDSRYAVAKRATEKHFYQRIAEEIRGNNQTGESMLPPGIDRARRNLRYLWRISCSDLEKRYLDFVKGTQREYGVDGCQNICLMILKTVCTREILKNEESVIYHKLSSYILKTALFHVLAQTDLIQDWTMESLADRYVDLLDKLSKWEDLPHFFFNNAEYLRKVFPDEEWCGETATKNLMDELNSTLKIQLLNRFGHVVNTFKKYKKLIDEKYLQLQQLTSHRFDYSNFLANVLLGKTLEEVIHQPFIESVRPDEDSRQNLVAGAAQDRQVSEAARVERISGPNSDLRRNIQRNENGNRQNTGSNRRT